MKQGTITFDVASGKYQLDDIALSCGTCLQVEYHGQWVPARVEYNDNWNRGYYLIAFNDEGRTGSIPLWGIKYGRIN